MYKRNLGRVVERSLRDTPVVLINGARQTGKTTLVRELMAKRPGYRYVSLDDAASQAAAQTDPIGFIEDQGERLAIDEVQKAPALFPAIKLTVDARRTPGRFLLTGSADVLALPTISESLAGRMEPRTLLPLSRGEIAGTEESSIAAMFGARIPLVHTSSFDRASLIRAALQGGYPSVFRRPEERRRDWFTAYLSTIVQRDVRDLADVHDLSAFPRVLSLLATRASNLLNMSDLSRASGIPLSTLQRYVALLEHTFLVHMIPAWSNRRSARLIKTPKVGFIDSGLQGHLSGVSAARLRREPDLVGPLLEGFVAAELRKQLGWSRIRAQLFHFRTHGGREVDLVLEADDGRVVGLEVKAATTIDRSTFRGLEALREAAGSRFHRGVVFYTGKTSLPFGPGLVALPIGALWEIGL